MSNISLLFKYKIGLRTIYMYVVHGLVPKKREGMIVAPTRDQTGHYVVVDDKNEEEIEKYLHG